MFDLPWMLWRLFVRNTLELIKLSLPLKRHSPFFQNSNLKLTKIWLIRLVFKLRNSDWSINEPKREQSLKTTKVWQYPIRMAKVSWPWQKGSIRPWGHCTTVPSRTYQQCRTVPSRQHWFRRSLRIWRTYGWWYQTRPGFRTIGRLSITIWWSL